MRIFLVVLASAFLGCHEKEAPSAATKGSSRSAASAAMANVDPANVAVATFAGGCFWCLEANMDGTAGVISAISGYAGGTSHTAKYTQVGAGKTAHREAVQVTYDKSKVSYEELLQVYWRSIDPRDAGGQFADRGKHYTTAIYVKNDEERAKAESSAKALASKLNIDKVATKIENFSTFFPAEKYHQDYAEKNPTHYQRYKVGSGRGMLKKLHGDKK